MIEYEIDLWATSNIFLPGHRIRLEVSSSNFPRFDRNPNTGELPGRSAEMVSALQTRLPLIRAPVAPHLAGHPDGITKAY